MTKFTLHDASFVIVEYSSDGNRLSRTQSGAKTWYAYDFGDANGFDDVVAEYNVTGGLVARYVHGPGIDEPLAMTRGGTFFYSFDALGSTTRLTTGTQTTNAVYRYEGFGMSRFQIEGAQSAYRFMSREWDVQGELYYFRARWYDPGSGRFSSKDSSGFVETPNLYEAFRSNPVLLTDPSGQGWWALVAAVGIWMATCYINQIVVALQRRPQSAVARGEGDTWLHCYVSCAANRDCWWWVFPMGTWATGFYFEVLEAAVAWVLSLFGIRAGLAYDNRDIRANTEGINCSYEFDLLFGFIPIPRDCFVCCTRKYG